MAEQTPEKTQDYTPLTTQQIEDLIEEVIEANAVWPDPLPSQVSAVMDIVREAMAQAWDEGIRASTYPPLNPARTNPYLSTPPGQPSDQPEVRS